ncbi:MAG: LamG-like jellyroll fold domain-containing protein, partial [Dehalococcoidia bacterium]
MLKTRRSLVLLLAIFVVTLTACGISESSDSAAEPTPTLGNPVTELPSISPEVSVPTPHPTPTPAPEPDPLVTTPVPPPAPVAVSVLSSGLDLGSQGAAVRSDGPATKVFDALTASGSFTLETWIATSSLKQSWGRILAYSQASSPSWKLNFRLYQNKRAASFRMRDSTGTENYVEVPDIFQAVDELKHYVVTFDGSTQRMFVDGVPIGVNSDVAGSFDTWDPDYPLLIGNEPSADRPWRGKIFLVAIYDRALSGEEIQQNLSRERRVTEGLVALYNFAEGAGDTVHDVSGVGTPLDLRITHPDQVQWLQDRDPPVAATPEQPPPPVFTPPSPTPPPTGSQATPPNFKVAFVGDQGVNRSARAVLELIKAEEPHLVLLLGDLGYQEGSSKSPLLWNVQLNDILGPNYPVFSPIGNHDVRRWSDYERLLSERQARVDGAECSGEYGVDSSCNFNGLFFILSGAGALPERINFDPHTQYVKERLSENDSIWRICTWHHNQKAMQAGGKGNEVGWDIYEECRRGGAIIATGHEHSYSRTKTLVNLREQTVNADWPEPGQLLVEPGSTFVFVSGLGGKSIRDQERCLP